MKCKTCSFHSKEGCANQDPVVQQLYPDTISGFLEDNCDGYKKREPAKNAQVNLFDREE